jgi:hypothetical protein
MPTFWGWSRAAPAPQANVRRRLLRRLSNAVMAFSRRKHGRTGRATSRVPPARVSALLRPSDSLRSRRLRAFVWGAGAARDQPQDDGIPRNPTPLGEVRGVEPVPTHQRGDLARLFRSGVRLREDLPLEGEAEGAPPRLAHEMRNGRPRLAQKHLHCSRFVRTHGPAFSPCR